MDNNLLFWLGAVGVLLVLIVMVMSKKIKPPYESLGITAEKWAAFEQGQFEDKELLQLLPGNKIYAIKFLRRKKDLSLKKAMEEINEMEKQK